MLRTTSQDACAYYEGQKLQLNTFCLGPDGNLWMCCSDHAGAPNAGSIMVVQPTGEFVARHELEFIPQAINFSQDGKVAFVARFGNDRQAGR